MNKREQELFLSFFEEVHETQQLIDRLKIDLTQIEGYNPHLLFDLISGGSDQITSSQMRSYAVQRFACNQRELYEIFQKFDWSRQGSISRQDFLRELSPFGRPPIEPRNRHGSFNQSIQAAFIALLIQILKRFRIVDVSRKQILFIQPYDAFSHLDIWKKGLIGLRQLQRFYEENDFEIGERQLFYLLHGLRRRCYRDVNLQVFCENLNPLQFGQYHNYADKIAQQNERQFLRRSRHEQQAMKRSRVQNQKLQHQVQRVERRRQAEVERQINLQERVNGQLSQFQRRQEQNIRRALLEQEQRVREKVILDSELLAREQIKRVEEQQRIRQLELLRERERSINQNLARSAYRKEAELQVSRRRLNYEKQLALREQLERDRQARRNISRIRDIELSRRQLQNSLTAEREKIMRQIEMERLRSSRKDQEVLARSIKRSRIEQLEKELDQTRAEMRERKNRLEGQSKYSSNIRSSQTKTYQPPSAYK